VDSSVNLLDNWVSPLVPLYTPLSLSLSLSLCPRVPHTRRHALP